MINTISVPWVQLRVPASLNSLPTIQCLLEHYAQSLGFLSDITIKMRTACEEALGTLLHLGMDDSDDEQALLDVSLATEGPALSLRLSYSGLPYDASLLPVYDVAQPEQASEQALAVHLMQELSDFCHVLNQGAQGQHIVLQWLLPKSAIDMAVQSGQVLNESPTLDAAQPLHAEDIEIRAFQPEDAIHLARLVYRSYGYSYVNPDMYLAERILARIQNQTLVSWVAALKNRPQNPIVGHIAFMKNRAEDDTLEVGAAVVAPECRGLGLLGKLLDKASYELSRRSEKAAFVHAVTAHPFTQKTFGRLGYLPTALLLAYTPASLKFRNISGPILGERGSVYYACRLLHQPNPFAVFLPQGLEVVLNQRAKEIGLPWKPQPVVQLEMPEKTQVDIAVEEALNAAFLHVNGVGSDFYITINKILKKLCRQRIDAIYLSLNLEEASTVFAAAQALELGFILAGLTPYMPWRASLCLQYLNNQELHADAVCVVGESAQHLHEQVFSAYHAQELI